MILIAVLSKESVSSAALGYLICLFYWNKNKIFWSEILGTHCRKFFGKTSAAYS